MWSKSGLHHILFWNGKASKSKPLSSSFNFEKISYVTFSSHFSVGVCLVKYFLNNKNCLSSFSLKFSLILFLAPREPPSFLVGGSLPFWGSPLTSFRWGCVQLSLSTIWYVIFAPTLCVILISSSSFNSFVYIWTLSIHIPVCFDIFRLVKVTEFLPNPIVSLRRYVINLYPLPENSFAFSGISFHSLVKFFDMP